MAKSRKTAEATSEHQQLGAAADAVIEHAKATLGAEVVNEPSPILLLLPTESDCRDYMVMDVEPIFEATPELTGAATTIPARSAPTARPSSNWRTIPGYAASPPIPR